MKRKIKRWETLNMAMIRKYFIQDKNKHKLKFIKINIYM